MNKYIKISENGIENFRGKVKNKKTENWGMLKRDNLWEEEQVMGESREISRRFLRKFHFVFDQIQSESGRTNLISARPQIFRQCMAWDSNKMATWPTGTIKFS